MGELDCATCLAFDIDKSPEPGWSPAEVETRRIPGCFFLVETYEPKSKQHPWTSWVFFLLLVSLEAIGLAFYINCAFFGGGN